MSDWWAQKLIVEYEEARGLRPPGVRRDGTFEVGASKTVAVPVCRAVRGVRRPGRCASAGCPAAAMRQARRSPARSLRFDWEDGASRVVVGFTATGEAKSQVAVQHERLPDARPPGR